MRGGSLGSRFFAQYNWLFFSTGPGVHAWVGKRTFYLSLKNSMMKTERRQTFHFPRTPLLIEIERRCAFSDCGAKNQIGLTKDEAIEYRGFECSKCERWNHDRLNQFELPDSWAKSS